MKNLHLYRIAIVVLLSACSGKPQTTDIPASVKDSLSTMFATSGKANWEVTSGFRYKARFLSDNKEVVASFDSTGKWLKTEIEMEASELPAVIVKTVTGAFYGNGITKAMKVEKPDSGITYEIFLKRRYNISPLVLSSGGVILNK
jgi:hypothetical protein